MKTVSTATILAILSLSIVPTFASEDDFGDQIIHGRSSFAIESSLRDRGIVTSGVEEWGSLIRAWVPNGAGGMGMQFFDADTLQPVVPSRS